MINIIKSTVLVVILTVLALSINYCVNPFSPRDSEDPSGQHGHWEVPSSPEVVLENLEWSYQEMILENFATCFVDSYHFSASPQDSATYPETFSNWDLSKEISITNAIFSSNDNLNTSSALMPSGRSM